MLAKILLVLALLFLSACGSKQSSSASAPLLGGLPTASPVPTPAPISYVGDSVIQDLLVRTNNERVAVGSAALVLDSSLTAISQAFAQDMATRNFFSHTSPDGLSPFDRMRNAGISYSTAGENIAEGYVTPADVIAAWMSSAGHKANILNANFGKVGLGFYQNYWVQDFTN